MGVSTLKEMLHDVLGDQPHQVERFASLYLRHQDDMPTFWSNLEAELGKATTQRLRLDGQLGYLTLNHAPLIRSLHHAEQKKPLTSTLDLARRGYYEAGKWLSLLDGTIPPHIPGETDAEKREKYAELLAAQVRLAFPTAVIAERVQHGDIPIPKAHGAAKGVYSFLAKHQGQFEIGVEPVERYLARHGLQEQEPVVTQIKRLQRVYQITPNDQALAELLKPEHELDSAYAITRCHDQESFVRTFGEALGEETARQTYAKAVQVHGAVLNIATSYLTARIAPPLGALPLGVNQPARVLDASPAAPRDGSSGVIAYPTLEDLFGSMDYCPCDECRSILSPAAYLVDLLHFIDHPPSPKSSFRNPQEVLFQRRPDLQYLALTCENTNVKLPYIDLVNETLEYCAFHGFSLFGYQGHDTDGSVSSDELMANPQFVEDNVYGMLKWEKFPLQLPFHRPLELLRLHFQKFGVKLQDAIPVLTPTGLIIPSWWNILIEEIGFSRQEYTLLIDSSIELQILYGYARNQSEDDVISHFSSIQNFSRGLGISYDDLIAILQTRFINPHAVLIPSLRRLGVPFKTLHALKDGSMKDEEQFKALLPADLDARKYGGSDVKDLQAVVKWVKNDTNYARITKIIVIDVPVDATDPNSVVSLKFCFCDPATSKLHKIDFVRLMRFIRLWKKLGLTIAQTDDIITALYPLANLPTGDDEKDLESLDAGFKVLLKRIGFLLQVMRRLNADRDLAPLLACWTPIGTTGEHSLYAKMFLTPTVLSQDPAFADDGYGNILQDETQLLLDHAPALCAAFSLRDTEFTQITTALGFKASPPSPPPTPPTPLTLENISAIYRHGWLARTLRLSLVEFLHLTRFTGLDPFAPLDPATEEPSEPPALRLIRLLQALKAASLKPEQALYLIWNEDISGKSAPPNSTITSLARTVRADCAAIETEFSISDDPTGDITKSRMALVYDTATTNFFFSLLDNTVETVVAYPNPAYPNPQLSPAQSILDAASKHLSYNDLRQQLTYTGVLDASTLAKIHNAIQSEGDCAALHKAVDDISAANHTLVDTFFKTYPDLLTLYQDYVASNEPLQKKQTALLRALLHGFKVKRKWVQALVTITAAAGTDPIFASAILDDSTVVHASHARTSMPAVQDVIEIEIPGLAKKYFPGKPDHKAWSGYLNVPQNGLYNLRLTAIDHPGNVVSLVIDGATVQMHDDGGGIWTTINSISLTASKLSAISIDIAIAPDELNLMWESKGLDWQIVPGMYLYSDVLVNQIRTVYLRFLKATSLARTLSLTANEIAYLASHSDFFIQNEGWLNRLAGFWQPRPCDQLCFARHPGVDVRLCAHQERAFTERRAPPRHSTESDGHAPEQ